jgi:hypothetical protein
MEKDYPESVSNNAKRGIKVNNNVLHKLEVRAQQLADRKPISISNN